jgi:hypothetical protein
VVDVPQSEDPSLDAEFTDNDEYNEEEPLVYTSAP